MDEYNPRLASDYFFPALRFVFPNPRVISDALREGKDNSALVPMAIVEKASRPYVLNYILGGQLYLDKFKKDTLKLSKNDMKIGKRVVHFDFFMLLALDLWAFADGFRSIREKRALGVLKRLFQRRKPMKGLVKAPPQTTPELDKPPVLAAKKYVASSKVPKGKKSRSKPATKLAKVKALDKQINKSKYAEV